MNLNNLVEYCEEFDLPSPFAGAYVPAPLNLETCINAIMVRCGLLTPCYNDPDTFRNITGIWFDRKQWTFEHLINVIQAEYSPIENVDEHTEEKTKFGHNNIKSGGYKDSESGTDNLTSSGNDKVTQSGTDSVSQSGKDITALSGKDVIALSGTDSTTDSGTDTVTLSGTDERDITHDGIDTTTNTISAFNANTYQPDNKSELDHGESIDDDITYGKTEETDYGKSESTTYGKTETVTNGKTETTTYGKKEDTTFGKSENTSYGKTEAKTFGHNMTRVYNAETDQEGGINEFERRRHGNIGVTTNQQMITAELELLRHFDIYGYIAELFEEENMLMIY